MDARTRTGGQRITANTLIRIAVDALLAQRSALVGDDEAALREAYFGDLRATAVEVAGWLCPITRDWIDTGCRVLPLLAERPHTALPQTRRRLPT